MQIYKLSAGGQSYSCIDTITFDVSSRADLPLGWRVTSLDWSTDGSLMRLTFDDFRKIYISRDEIEEKYKEDSELLAKLIDRKEEMANIWASETCLLRWETLGVFSPDPTQINCLGKVTICDQTQVLTGLSSLNSSATILKLFDWPCLTPQQQPSAEVTLAPGL